MSFARPSAPWYKWLCDIECCSEYSAFPPYKDSFLVVATERFRTDLIVSTQMSRKLAPAAGGSRYPTEMDPEELCDTGGSEMRKCGLWLVGGGVVDDQGREDLGRRKGQHLLSVLLPECRGSHA